MPDILGPDLRVLFVGINPGKRSAETGHHFAGHTNLFWRLLHESDLTPSRFAHEEDGALPRLGIGLTNLATRATRGVTDLTPEEMAAGGAALRERVESVRPRVAAFLGKDPYAYYAGIRTSRVVWGRQEPPVTPGVVEYVAPNPSTRSTIPYPQRLGHFTTILRLAEPRRNS